MNQQFTEKEKNAARRAVRAAILSGKLVRPSTCSKCGTVPEAPKGTARAIHAHHTDYSRPLDVEWICAKCHRAETPLPEKMGAPVFGERNGQSKLTASDARAIRESPLGCRRLAKLYGVDKKTIQWVRNGTQWREAASPAPSEGGKGVEFCSVCRKPFGPTETRVGTGDGTMRANNGRGSFAHRHCYEAAAQQAAR